MKIAPGHQRLYNYITQSDGCMTTHPLTDNMPQEPANSTPTAISLPVQLNTIKTKYRNLWRNLQVRNWRIVYKLETRMSAMLLK